MHPTRSSFILTPRPTGTTVGFIAVHPFHRSQPTIGPGLNPKNIRSFSRYEHYLLEQAINGNCWIEPTVKEDSMEMLKPHNPQQRQSRARISVEQDFVAKHPGTSRKETSRNQKRHPLCGRQTRATLPFYQRLLLGKCQQCHQSFGLPPFRFRPRRPHHRQGIYHLVLQRKGNRTFQRLPMGQDMEKSGMTNK